MRFDELNLSEAVLRGLDAMNFKEMTPVQELSIPPILEGKDVIACAQTGTGKTAAYVLPVINKLSSGNYPDDAINAIVMAPTRELAQQIDQQIEGFSFYVDVSAVAVYGGTDGIVYAQQERGLQMGADIVIATPGRLIAHLNLGGIDLSRVSFFILDEADRMLDMGFYEDIIQIYKLLPQECQIIMFSATMPPKIKTLAENIMKEPVEVEIAIAKPPESIMQTAYICYERQKLHILEKQFKDMPPKRVIIFSSSKQKVKTLTSTLKRMNINVADMHSDLEQNVREQVMRDFKNGHIDVLVATDVVSRGIDINDISLIINYDIPNDPEDYVHRIGRTARGTDGKGLSITLVSEQEQYGFKAIETFLGKAIYKIPLDPELGATPVYDPDKKRPEKTDRGSKSGERSGRKSSRTYDNKQDYNKPTKRRKDKSTTSQSEQTSPSEEVVPVVEATEPIKETPVVATPAPNTDKPEQQESRRTQHANRQTSQPREGQKPQGDKQNQQQSNNKKRPRGYWQRQQQGQLQQQQQGDRQQSQGDRQQPQSQNDRQQRQNGRQSYQPQRRNRQQGDKQTQKPRNNNVPRNNQADNTANKVPTTQNVNTSSKRKWWEFWKTKGE